MTGAGALVEELLCLSPEAAEHVLRRAVDASGGLLADAVLMKRSRISVNNRVSTVKALAKPMLVLPRAEPVQ